MLRYLCLLLLLALLPTSFLSAQEKKEEKPPFEAPNPLHLDPEWWTPFEEAEGDELREQITTTIDTLNEIERGLDEEERARAFPLINRIEINLQALITAREKKAPILPPPPKPQTIYTLNEYLRLGLKVHNAEREAEDSKQQVAQERTTVANADRYIDGLWVRYLDMKEANAAKLRLGLEIMAQQSALAITQESLRIEEQVLENSEEGVAFLQKELSRAADRIDLSTWNEEALEGDLNTTKTLLAQRQAELAEAEANALGSFGDSPKERAEHELLEQRTLLASAQEATARATKLFLSIEQLLYRYANNLIDPDQSTMWQEVSSWQKEIDHLRQRSTEWHNSTAQEQEAASAAYAALYRAGEEADPKLIAIQEERLDAVRNTYTALEMLDGQLLITQLLLDRMKEEVLKKSSLPSRIWTQAKQKTATFWSRSTNWLYYPLFKVRGVPFTPLSILRIVIILAGAVLISRLVRFWLHRIEETRSFHTRATIYNLGRLIHYAIITLGIIIALMSIGLDMNKLIIIAGALSVGIGFGLQNIVNNFLSGLIILFARNVKVGDVVELEDGQHARVIAINIQNSILKTFDGIDVIVPNSDLTSKRLINWTMQDPFRRVRIPFGVAYGSDKELVRKVVVEAALKLSSTVANSKKYPGPQVRLVELGDSALNFELVFWINLHASRQFGATKAAYVWEIETALRENGITIPFPQRDIHIQSEPKEPSD